MEENLRNAWTQIIVADELDDHLDDLGQAKINAQIVNEMLNDYKLPRDSKILMPGCGTGQIFDYLSPDLCKNYNLTFTDINQSFLNKLSERLSLYCVLRYRCLLDDIEETNIFETFDGIIPVLVLEQLEWEKAIDTLVNYNPQFLYLIIQEQSCNTQTITVNVKSRDSIRKFSEMANPQLVPRNELIKRLGLKNYKLCSIYERDVPNNKQMVGLVFSK